MKNRLFRSVFSLLLVLLIIIGIPNIAFAADSNVSFDKDKMIVFEPGSVYSDTDLFQNFKGVMPGDQIEEDIKVENKNSDFDYLKVYMRAVLNDDNDNPISAEVLKELQADSRNQVPVTDLEYMFDFLSQLSMKVWNGSELIYESSPDQLNGLADNVYLGSLAQNEVLSLKVDLEVPIELGNEYMDRIGEVDWVFVFEGYNETSLTVEKIWQDKNVNHPDKITVNLLKDDVVEKSVELSKDNDWTYTWENLNTDYKWTVEEVVPEGYVASYEVKDNVITIINALKEPEKTEPTKPEPTETKPSETKPTKTEIIKPVTTTKATTKPITGENSIPMFLFAGILLALAVVILIIRIQKGKIKK